MTWNKDACVLYVSPQDTHSGIVTHICTASHFVTIRISALASDVHMTLETRPSSQGPSSTGGERPHMSREGLKTAEPPSAWAGPQQLPELGDDCGQVSPSLGLHLLTGKMEAMIGLTCTVVF